MKKLAILALAALLVVAFTVPASALENIFGGYWRTRMFQQRNFEGDSGVLAESKDSIMVDTRTRIYYTAKINDNLKLVNKFEIDTNWGAGVTGGWGKDGTDVTDWQIKNSYADFNVGPVNFQVGAQLFSLARGFVSGEDGIGMKAIWKINDGLYLPFIWKKMMDGHDVGVGEDRTRQDIDQYVIAPIIMLSKDIKISPYYVFMHSQDALYFATTATNATLVIPAGSLNNLNLHVFGLDFDGKFGPASVWFTGVMQEGTAGSTNAGLSAGITDKADVDISTYLVNLGGKFDLGKADVHGNFIYATGQSKALSNTNREIDAFIGTASQIYVWAEILSGGVVDTQVPVGAPAPGNKVSNVMALNLGTTVKPMDKLSITADLWYAKLAEERTFANGKKADKLGLEVDLTVSYKLVEGLTLDVIGAYLFAGDAISTDGKNDTNPYELVTQLSLSF